MSPGTEQLSLALRKVAQLSEEEEERRPPLTPRSRLHTRAMREYTACTGFTNFPFCLFRFRKLPFTFPQLMYSTAVSRKKK